MHRSFLGRKRWTEDCRQSKGMEVRKDSLFKRSDSGWRWLEPEQGAWVGGALVRWFCVPCGENSS